MVTGSLSRARVKPIKYRGRVLECMSEALLKNSRMLVAKTHQTLSRSGVLLNLSDALVAKVKARRNNKSAT